MAYRFFKDASLDALAMRVNVAQFVSFAPDLTMRLSRMRGMPVNAAFDSPIHAIATLLALAPAGKVNVRSFDPATPESREFVYGIGSVNAALAVVVRLAASGLYTIVNELIDVNDGGVSGVIYGDTIEFAPNDTPRCVEKPGVCALPRNMGLRLLASVYGFAPAINFPASERVEFSLHPLRQGVRESHTVVWQSEDAGESTHRAAMSWPNRFSRHVGDKAFGLLIADALGEAVPRTTVIPRNLPPFTFGDETGSGETWLRTCPTEQRPGLFTTTRGWSDPFALLMREDAHGDVASVLAQEGVTARFSGAASIDEEGASTVEGVAGNGDEFMLGERAPEPLPPNCIHEVRDVLRRIHGRIGAARIEWVDDGTTIWIVQLHCSAVSGSADVIVLGNPERFMRFAVTDGIEAFRDVAEHAAGVGEGIVLVGNVGTLSHFGDILRRLRVPSRIERPAA